MPLEHENVFTVNLYIYLFYFLLPRHPRGKFGGGSVCDIINNTVRMKGSGTPPPHPPVSPLFLLPCYSSMLNTSASAFACVAWIYMNVSPAGDNGGQVIDMCRRTQDKQPTPTGVTPARLIHFDWAKTEGVGGVGVGGQWNWGGLKAGIKWQKGSSFSPAPPDSHKMDPCKC